MKKEKTHGGARKGAGRKPASDPKIGITLYIEESTVNSLGGIDVIRNDCYDFLKKKLKKP